MIETQAKAILAGLSPEARAERQRIVDAAVRAARDSQYCDTFNTIIARLMPEMVASIGGYRYALDSDGRCCAQRDSDQRSAWGYLMGENDSHGAETYDAGGYSLETGRDRDGFDRVGYDAEGFDANDRGRAYQRVQRRTRWTDEAGKEQTTAESVYLTGYGRYTMRDAEGNLRVGRPATEEELAADEAARAERARLLAGRFNPTTWQPEPGVDYTHNGSTLVNDDVDDDDDDQDDDDSDY